MKKKPDCCPIVVVGAWNRAIFSPEWVQKYIFAPNEKFEIKIPQPHLIDASFQFVTPEFAFNIIGERLEFRLV
ncbi:MAG: hypothetical protein K2I90_06805, partial [Odoribacter sp.]|nr:hypothetical protein [Odoribacter sp.]